MKGFSSRPTDHLKSCAWMVLSYVILFQIIERTRMIEKVMTLNFTGWELFFITAFIVSRLVTYLLVPSALLALGAWKLADYLESNRRR